MNCFVYVIDLLGIRTNADNFSWVYGTVAPKASEVEFNNRMVKINLSVRNSADVLGIPSCWMNMIDTAISLHNFINRKSMMKEVIPFLLIPTKKRKSIHAYLSGDFLVDPAEITHTILLGKRNWGIRINNGLQKNLLNLNKYVLNYHRSQTTLVMNYFNPDFSMDKMYEIENFILGKFISCNAGYRINFQNALDYSKLIIENVIEEHERYDPLIY